MKFLFLLIFFKTINVLKATIYLNELMFSDNNICPQYNKDNAVQIILDHFNVKDNYLKIVNEHNLPSIVFEFKEISRNNINTEFVKFINKTTLIVYFSLDMKVLIKQEEFVNYLYTVHTEYMNKTRNKMEIK